MAKRALGALPKVEPRSAPLFAPAAAGLAGVGSHDSGIQEVSAEVESSRGGVDRWQRSRQRLSEEGRLRNQPGENLQEIPVRGAIRPESPAPARANAGGPESAIWESAITEPRSSQTQIPREAAARSGAATENPAQQRQLRSGQRIEEQAGKLEAEEEREAEGVAGVIEQRKTSGPTAGARATTEGRAVGEVLERGEARQEAILTSALIERIVEVEKAQERSEELELAVRPGAKTATQQRQPEQRIAARNETKASLPDAPAEQKTEIHISIGSIELRAPRVEARPQAAPFRPRLTLNDFLRRKPEAGR